MMLMRMMMRCLESCYWNLIEEKFCFDESIALYQEPQKRSNEKNNNMFDNIAFYDSVAVIAGRAIVTIEPLDSKKNQIQQLPVVIEEQPKKRLKWPEKNSKALDTDFLKPPITVPLLFNNIEKELNKPKNIFNLNSSSSTDDTDYNENETQQKELITRKIPARLGERYPIKKSVSFHNIPDKTLNSIDETDYKLKAKSSTLPEEEVEVTFRDKKSLRERRMSKSLSLRIDFPKEIPIIRQNSMPKFYLDTPDENQMKDSALIKTSTVIFKSPLNSGFNFDLQSVVQMEKERQTIQAKVPPVPIHRETSKLNLFKDKILLKKSKSTVSASNLPHTNHI